jgi:hypothetical protein
VGILYFHNIREDGSYVLTRHAYSREGGSSGVSDFADSNSEPDPRVRCSDGGEFSGRRVFWKALENITLRRIA